MIIFPNAIFLHVPKTSGSSFEKMCLERHGRKKVGHIHNSAVDIAKGERDKWVFGFMRHPVLAEYSNYRYHKYSWKGNDKFTFTNFICVAMVVSQRDYLLKNEFSECLERLQTQSSDANPQVIKNLLDTAKRCCLKVTRRYEHYIEQELH